MYKYLFIFISLIAFNFSNCYSVSLEKEVVKAPMFAAEQYIEKFFNYNNNLYTHLVSEVKDNGYVLVLEDGSEWQISWWYKGKVKNWQQGDIVNATYTDTFGSIKLSNTTVKQAAWGTMINGPKYTNPNTLFIYKIEHGVLLTLSDGGILESKEMDTMSSYNWQEGDIVFVMSNEKNKEWPYQIWNFSKGVIILSFKLVQEPEVLCHPCN